jgi:hypothetical protein
MTDNLSYLSHVELLDEPRFEAAESPPPKFTDEAQVVAVRAQLTEFSDTVSADLRRTIADGMLLAQLAADKVAADREASNLSQDVFAWYKKYVEVLKKIGWVLTVEDLDFKDADNSVVSLHRAIIPVLTAMLGPQLAVLPMVISVLRGLEEMDQNSPWITLFDRSSQHAQGAKFQVGYVTANAQGDPQMVLACFGVDARRKITQVLFLKSSVDQATIKKASTTLTNTVAGLNDTKAIIRDRVKLVINDSIMSVDI